MGILDILLFIIVIYAIAHFTLDVVSDIKDVIISIVNYIREQKRKKR